MEKKIYTHQEILHQINKEKTQTIGEDFFNIDAKHSPLASEKMIQQNKKIKAEILSTILKQKKEKKILLQLSTPMLHALENICEQIYNNIMNGTYGLIITDDASARMPSHILRKTINTVNKKKGLPHIKIGHIKGRVHNSDIEILDKTGKTKTAPTGDYLNGFIEKLNFNNKKILIVSETTITGSGLGSRLHMTQDKEFDLATLDYKPDSSIYDPKRRKIDLEKIDSIIHPFDKNHEGQKDFHHDYIYHNLKLSHVKKDPDAPTIHSKRVALSKWQKDIYLKSKNDSKIIIAYLVAFLENLNS